MSKNTAILYDPAFMRVNRPNTVPSRKSINVEFLKARYNLGLAVLVTGWMGGYQYLTRNNSNRNALVYIKNSKALRIALPFCLIIHVARFIANYGLYKRRSA